MATNCLWNVVLDGKVVNPVPLVSERAEKYASELRELGRYTEFEPVECPRPWTPEILAAFLRVQARDRRANDARAHSERMYGGAA